MQDLNMHGVWQDAFIEHCKTLTAMSTVIRINRVLKLSCTEKYHFIHDHISTSFL